MNKRSAGLPSSVGRQWQTPLFESPPPSPASAATGASPGPVVSLWLISVKPSLFFGIQGDWPELDLEAEAYTGSAAAQSKEPAEAARPSEAQGLAAKAQRRNSSKAEPV